MFFIIRKNYNFNIVLIFSFHSIELVRLRIEWRSILTYVSKAWHEVFAWKLSVIYQVEATRNHSSKTSMFTYQDSSMCTYIFPTPPSTPNLEKRIVYPFPMLFVVRNNLRNCFYYYNTSSTKIKIMALLSENKCNFFYFLYENKEVILKYWKILSLIKIRNLEE